MHRSPTLFGTAAVALVFAAAACSGGRDRSRPPLVVISIDTLRADRLPAYGYRTGSTPAIDSLAGDGILFERAFSDVPLTLPSHVSLFTGLRPPSHGVRDNIGFPVDPRRGTVVAELLKAAGYTTWGAVSAQVLARRTGIARGFDRWSEPGDGASSTGVTSPAERPGREAIATARQWLAEPRTADSPPFLFVHLYEPHAPYRPPEPARSRFTDPYDGEIATADALVRDLLDALREAGIYDEALVVLLSDHGESLGEHGEDEHGILLHRAALQVPLIVKLPRGERAGQRVTRNVALLDVVPTLIERLGLDHDAASLPGVSLLAGAVPADRPLYAETVYPLVHFGWSDLASVIAGDLHLVEGRRTELFDFVRDPGENIDLSGTERRPLAAMRRFLDGIDRTLDPPAAADAETARVLGALGYLGQAVLPSERSNLDDPRDRVREVAPILRGIRHYHEGEYAEAIALLSTAVRGGVATPHAWQFLGASYDAVGRKAEAAEAYARGMRLAGSPSYLAETAALRLLELGRPKAALELVRGELARHTESARLRVLLSRALLQTGRIEEAERAADQAIALDAAFADGYYQRAVIALARRDGSTAIPDLERAATLDARHVEARKALAMLQFALGDSDAARRRLEEVLAIDPDDADARADLAQLATNGGT